MSTRSPDSTTDGPKRLISRSRTQSAKYGALSARFGGSSLPDHSGWAIASLYIAGLRLPCWSMLRSTRLRRFSAAAPSVLTGSNSVGDAMIPASNAESAGVSSFAHGFVGLAPQFA